MHPARRQIVKESYRSAPVTPNTYIDPPRPAREGCEWVWFPAGYWAEREIAESPGKVMKHFKWRKRSGKSSSGWDTQDGLERLWDQIPKISQTFFSPFSNEESHTQSFQGSSFNRYGTTSEGGKSMFPLNRTPQSPLPSPYLTEEAHVQSLQRSPQGFRASEGIIPYPQPAIPTQRSLLTVVSADSGSATPLATTISQPPGTSEASVISIPSPAVIIPDAKPKRSLFSKLFPDPKPKIKKIHSDSDAYDYDYSPKAISDTQVQPPSPSRKRPPVPIMSRVSTLLREESKRRRSFKLFGKSPWHRKASAGSKMSDSSSIRDMLRGRTPVTSPVSYIEPAHAFCTQFPGGEATRVQTPPLRESGRHSCRPQSFFFDISTPPRHGPSSNRSSSEPGPSRRPAPFPPPTAENTTAPFEFDMPEHLPNSPMCPANKRHSSGGTGVCVYHGRRKRSRALPENDMREDDGEDGDRWM
ncbi:hypothetical protein F5Y11DRAFT_350951 [Daldinia sp. FL1419]|nr:hypothetical protein F5Y11DRAFT_350951 [Daldinia sp. FL1419]